MAGVIKKMRAWAAPLYKKAWSDAHELMTNAHWFRRVLFVSGVILIVIPVAALIWLPGATIAATLVLLFLVNLGRKEADP